VSARVTETICRDLVYLVLCTTPVTAPFYFSFLDYPSAINCLFFKGMFRKGDILASWRLPGRRKKTGKFSIFYSEYSFNHCGSSCTKLAFRIIKFICRLNS
jgi:hypothetical protein